MPAPVDNQALGLRWSFGFNYDIPGGVQNLADGKRRAMFYAAAHTGIIYDLANHKQKALQGHCNQITCLCASADRRWLVTADSGPDSMIVVWDSYTGTPLKTIFQPHPAGVIALDISADSQWIVSLSAVEVEGDAQQISIWDWSSESTAPLATAEVTAKDLQTFVLIHPEDKAQIVTNGLKRVIFWQLEGAALKFYSPPVSSKEIKQAVGLFTQSLFLPGTEQACTGTQDGDILLWDQVGAGEEGARQTDKKAVKIVRVHNSPINVLTCINQFVVTGGEEGFVRFFDFKLRIVAWFEDLNAGPIRSISFSQPAGKGGEEEFGAGGAGEPGEDFEVPDFVVATGSASVVRVQSAVFQKLNPEERRGELLLRGVEGSVDAIAAHPFLPLVAAAGSSGALHLWDYEERRQVSSRRFEKLHASALAFDANARFLAVGFTSGTLKLLRPAPGDRLEELQSFRQSKEAISHVLFSPDVRYLATADLDRCIVLYRFEEAQGADGKPRAEWVYIGKARGHYKAISDVTFGKTREGRLCLLSAGRDRSLVEYDLENSSITKGLLMKEITKIEQSATPTALAWSTGADGHDVLIAANDQFKFKLFSLRDKLCRRTLLGPTYGGPLTRILLLPGPDEANPYLAYATAYKVVGLVKMPLDGNPNRAMGMIAHPAQVAGLVPSHDGKYLLTAGGADHTLQLWQVDAAALEATVSLGGEGMDPFLAMIEGGKGGPLHQEIIDYFYYAQLRAQGEETRAPREVPGHVPLSEAANLMRALGFYPTEREVEEIVNEMKYAEYDATGALVTHVDLDTLIRVYVNHRPLAGIGREQIEEAFAMLGVGSGEGEGLDRDALVRLLTGSGEALSPLELRQCLASLVGAERLEEAMDGDLVSPAAFAHQVLGFEDPEEAAAGQHAEPSSGGVSAPSPAPPPPRAASGTPS
eukprot:tig00020554_g10888.t1